MPSAEAQRGGLPAHLPYGSLTSLEGSWFCPHISPSEAPSPRAPVHPGGLGVQGTTGWGHFWPRLPEGSSPKGFPSFPKRLCPSARNLPGKDSGPSRAQQSLDFRTRALQDYSGWVCVV